MADASEQRGTAFEADGQQGGLQAWLAQQLGAAEHLDRCTPGPGVRTPPAVAWPPTAGSAAFAPPTASPCLLLAGHPGASAQPHPLLSAAVAALMPLAMGGACSAGGESPLPSPPSPGLPSPGPWPALTDDSRHSLQLQAPAGQALMQPPQPDGGDGLLTETGPLLPLLAAAAAAGAAADQAPAWQPASRPAAAAAGASTAGHGPRHAAGPATGGRQEVGQLPFRPHATPSIRAAMAARLPSGLAVRGARTPASSKGSGEQAGSWQTWVSEPAGGGRGGG